MMGYTHLITEGSVAFGTSCLIHRLAGEGFAYVSPVCESIQDYMTSGAIAGLWPDLAMSVAIGAVCFFVGALLPDIDTPTSLLGRHFHLPATHRGITHSLLVALPLLALGLLVPAVMWLALGYVLHIALDAVSVGGVCLAYPLTTYTVYPSGAVVAPSHKVRIYRTGSMSEGVFATVVCVVFIGAGLASLLWSGQ